MDKIQIKEILCQQLELLAKENNNCMSTAQLTNISNAMVNIAALILEDENVCDGNVCFVRQNGRVKRLDDIV